MLCPVASNRVHDCHAVGTNPSRRLKYIVEVARVGCLRHDSAALVVADSFSLATRANVVMIRDRIDDRGARLTYKRMKLSWVFVDTGSIQPRLIGASMQPAASLQVQESEGLDLALSLETGARSPEPQRRSDECDACCLEVAAY